MFTFKKELDTTDLIKSCVAIVGAILAFVFITSIQLKNENTKLNLELTKLIPNLQPHIQTNFTNEVDKNDPQTINLKLYLKVISNYYVYYFPPSIKIIKKGSKNTEYSGKYQIIGGDLYEGLFSPGTEYNINYRIVVEDKINMNEYDIVADFDVDTDQSVQDAFAEVLRPLSHDVHSVIDELSFKKHKFRDKIYRTNPSFEDFFEKPEVR